jgi:tetratricopeptide (TPR) repeat protein
VISSSLLRRTPIDGALVALVALLLFLPALGYDLVWDDLGLLNAVERTVGMSGIRGLFTTSFSTEVGQPTPYYRPVPCVSLALDAWLGGGRPAFFHGTNVALHVANSLLVWLLARRFVASRSAALLAALLFAVHPVHVESVAFVSGRTDLWAAFLSLLATLAWWVSRTGDERMRRLAAAASVCFYAFACLAKETAIVVPLVLVAWDLLERSVRADIPGWIRRNGVWLACTACWLIAYLAMRVTVVGATAGEDAPNRLGSSVNVVFEYMRLVVAPWPLNAFYTEQGIRLRPANLGFGALFLAFACLLVVQRATRRKAGAACIWLVAFLAPALGFVSFSAALVAERFLYLPSVGAALLVATALDWKAVGARRLLIVPGVAVIIAAFSVLTWVRLPVWSTGVSLYGDLVTKSPDYLPAQENLGLALRRRGQHEEAIAFLEAALAEQPRYAGFHNGLGLSFAALGRGDEAVRAFKRAVAFEPDNAEYSLYLEARINLGEVYLTLGRYPDAAAAFEDALRIDPDNASALFGGAVAHARSGDAGRATALGTALGQVDPDLAERLRVTLGMASAPE